MRRIVASLTVLLSLFLATSLVFAGGKKEQQEQMDDSGQLPEEIVVGWSPPDVTGVFSTATDYFERAAEDARSAGLNVRIVTQSPASHTDFADQVGIIEDYIARDVDAIVISPTEVEVVKPAIRSANEAGIPVIVVNLLDPIDGVDVESYIGFSNVDAGAISGYAVVDYFGGPGVLGEGRDVDPDPSTYLDLDWWQDLYSDVNPDDIDVSARIAIVEGIAGGFFSRQRLSGFNSVIEDYDGINVVTTLPADWNRQKAVTVTQDILQAHDNLDAIWAASNEMGIGATIPIQQQGLEDEIEVFTNDGTPESLEMIRNGEIVAETWHGFPEWGWFGTRFAVRAALGLEVPDSFDIRPRIEYQGNADQFYPDVALEPHPWDEIIEEYQSAQ
jgi:ribose transport system substrate-binding protein